MQKQGDRLAFATFAPRDCHILHAYIRPRTPIRTKEQTMQTIARGYKGLSVLMDLNWDLALYLCTIAFALCAGAFIGSFY
jgi:hypothetical protein